MAEGKPGRKDGPFRVIKRKEVMKQELPLLNNG
jgi:hypothetical protein